MILTVEIELSESQNGDSDSNLLFLFFFDRCSIEFGFQANVLKSNVIYVPPAVAAADYTPAIIGGKPALTAASLATLRLEAEKQRNKEVHQLKLSKPKFYATLWETMSIESEEEVSQHSMPYLSK